MKISYQHLINYIPNKPNIEDISDKLFQLGHEHEIENDIFDIEFTPNRGDCLSVQGLVRDLAVFYKIKIENPLYKGNIDPLDIRFNNKEKNSCTKISFLKVDIDERISPYKNELKSYFDLMEVSKNNFFTDISNYLSYETGQPTHCYDATKIDSDLELKFINNPVEFSTLLGKKIRLEDRNLVFTMNNQIINLAGIVGGESTACSLDTKSVIIECAHFNPKDIIGKSIKYDIKSDAAHKFERGVNQCGHEKILRRFVKIVEDHASIKNLQLFSETYQNYEPIYLPFDENKINTILGTNIPKKKILEYLVSLGFDINKSLIKVPPYRSDINNQNDIAEEIARSIGYDNIKKNKITIPVTKESNKESAEIKVKSLLIDNGFYEVINNPFSSDKTNNSVQVDNPLDSNKNFLRANLKNSLVENLLYNERRQKDSIKLFELSDIYTLNNIKKRVLGIIASGRQGKNYEDFNKKIDIKYFQSIFSKYINNFDKKIETISRQLIQSKSKNEIVYLEIELNDLNIDILSYRALSKIPNDYIKYVKISEYPCSIRDLSFSIKNFSQSSKLENLIGQFHHELLKEVFIFDYYKNDKMNEWKC